MYYVSQFRHRGKNDDEVISLCISEAKKEKNPIIVFDEKNYLISQAVTLFDGITIILDGCTLKQADYTYDNVFRGENVIVNPQSPNGVPLACKPISNIRIVGKNGAVISGPDKNRKGIHSVLNEEQEMVGDFWGWRTLTVSLSNCTDFEICGIKFEKSRCWTLSFDMCKNGYIHDLEIYTNVKNGDGIDLRSGCRNIKIENISGNTSDDSVACTALYRKNRIYPDGNYQYPLEPSCCVADRTEADFNVSDITIKNITTGGRCHGIICLAANGCRVHDIEIDGVKETVGEWREATVKNIYRIRAKSLMRRYKQYYGKKC